MRATSSQAASQAVATELTIAVVVLSFAVGIAALIAALKMSR